MERREIRIRGEADKEIRRIPSADHFLFGHEREVAEAVGEIVADLTRTG